MTDDNDDLLLEQFFQPARQMELADDGFTRRVMHSLPERRLQLSRLWTAFCLAVGLLLFTLVGGWHMLLAWLLRLLTTMPTTGQVLQLWVAVVGVVLIGCAELLRREHIRMSYL